jgi:hypothetical protein
MVFLLFGFCVAMVIFSVATVVFSDADIFALACVTSPASVLAIVSNVSTIASVLYIIHSLFWSMYVQYVHALN